jgi:hypothetical protein
VCKTVNHPIDHVFDPSTAECSKEEYGLFNRIIGELQHLSNHTRPDITYAVNHLARFLKNPSSQHINAAKRVWRYVAGTLDNSLEFRKMEHLELEAYSDSDFAGDIGSSRSTSGVLIKLAGAPIIWKSQLQKEVTLSSTEAEYVALTEAAREICWVKNLFTELQDFTKMKWSAVKVHVDNQSAISLVRDHTNSRRSRHISLRNHFCREQHEKGTITVEYINTTKQLADVLTKPKSPNALF